jgi:hypothetical protein
MTKNIFKEILSSKNEEVQKNEFYDNKIKWRKYKTWKPHLKMKKNMTENQ